MAALVGLAWVVLAGPEVAVPAIALLALVHVGGRLREAARGEAVMVHPDLALVIVANAVAVLAVQLLLSIEGAV